MLRCWPGLGRAIRNRIWTASFFGWVGCMIQAQEFDFPILLPKWINDFSLRTGAGYRDNVGLSARSAQDSAFVATGLEIMLLRDRKSTRLNSSHITISYAVFCLKKKTKQARPPPPSPPTSLHPPPTLLFLHPPATPDIHTLSLHDALPI